MAKGGGGWGNFGVETGAVEGLFWRLDVFFWDEVVNGLFFHGEM